MAGREHRAEGGRDQGSRHPDDLPLSEGGGAGEQAEGPLALAALTSAEFVEAAKARLSRGAGRAREVYRHALSSGRLDPAQAGLSDEASRDFHAHFLFTLPEVVRTVDAPGEQGMTQKAALRLADGLEVECVHIPMGRGRSSLCISSQVGCKMGCTFCETGRMGLLRSLRTEEIVGQLLVARHVLGWGFRNVVFMGMGEALDNWPAVVQALRVMTDGGGMAMAQEHLTVCTVGHVEGIRRLGALGMKRLNLSVSLNSARDEARAEMMPVARKWPLDQLSAALADYRTRDNFLLGINYCLMPGLNDSEADLDAIAAFAEPLGRAWVNLIPYNPGSDPLTRAPREDEIEAFVLGLRERGLAVRRRITKGREVMAGCGQLGNLQLRRARRSPSTD